MSWRVAAFYRFFTVADPQHLVEQIQGAVEAFDGLCGTVLVAKEGVNATLAGKPGVIEPAVDAILCLVGREVAVKWSLANRAPFRRLRIRARPEIVTFGKLLDEAAPRTARHVGAAEWRSLLDRDDVLVLDVRNDYEIHAGRFKGAIDPRTESFTDFARYVDERLAGHEHQPIAMYCTGGIRCEKASSLLLEKGFQEVLQLRGGVLGYFEESKEAPKDEPDSPWLGECFVFDGRTTVKPDLHEGSAVTCRHCGWPVSAEEQNDPRFEPGRGCPHCADAAPGSRR